MKIKYEKIQGETDSFLIEVNDESAVTGIRNPEDRHGMNWVKPGKAWGTVTCKYDMSVSICRSCTETGRLKETYIFRNDTDFAVYSMGTGTGIYIPLPDYYTKAEICLTKCCNTHIWCGKSSSYIMALRMGGEAPHLGMMLRRGKLQGYSIERPEYTEGREEELSNQRGDFILHPENFHLCPGESYVLEWELFWFQDKEDFRNILREEEDYISAEAVSHMLFLGEKISFTAAAGEHKGKDVPAVRDKEERMQYRQSGSAEDAFVVRENGTEIEYQQSGCSRILVERYPEKPGEYVYQISRGCRETQISCLVMPPLWEMAGRRCRFLAAHQQCREEGYLKGAYLIYDNEEKQQYYSHLNDHNGGRERAGMGVLTAHYLQHCPDAELEKSLDQYLEYVLRELFDENTGEVFNDAPRCRDYIRLYNYPWISRFFLELYQLKQEEIFLDRFFKSAEFFYQEGGSHFYAIGMPMHESIRIFREAGRGQQAGRLLSFYEEHGEFILSCGKNYPAHEVDYEQSIVAPAAIYLCELYALTGKEKYRSGAEEQLQVLDLFQGFQPDYHMNETAVRHWDGYWFGKRRCLGDTYPHYWSSLSGCAYALAEEMKKDGSYEQKAEKTLRAVLSLFREDGSASCAMVYPMSVNGRPAHFYDPWANDQDWGLYFALKYSKKAVSNMETI